MFDESGCDGQSMKVHEFTLILTTEPTEEEADRLFSVFNDATLATSVGIPQIRFHREASSLETAIDSALMNVTESGFEVIRIEIEPQVVAQNTHRLRSQVAT